MADVNHDALLHRLRLGTIAAAIAMMPIPSRAVAADSPHLPSPSAQATPTPRSDGEPSQFNWPVEAEKASAFRGFGFGLDFGLGFGGVLDAVTIAALHS